MSYVKFMKKHISPCLTLLSSLSGMVMWKKFQSKHNLKWEQKKWSQWSNTQKIQFYNYRDADKSLARPDWKNNWKVAIFRPTQRSLLPQRPGWTDNLLNCFWVACQS